VTGRDSRRSGRNQTEGNIPGFFNVTNKETKKSSIWPTGTPASGMTTLVIMKYFEIILRHGKHGYKEHHIQLICRKTKRKDTAGKT
jgi:hypothetical protein